MPGPPVSLWHAGLWLLWHLATEGGKQCCWLVGSWLPLALRSSSTPRWGARAGHVSTTHGMLLVGLVQRVLCVHTSLAGASSMACFSGPTQPGLRTVRPAAGACLVHHVCVWHMWRSLQQHQRCGPGLCWQGRRQERRMGCVVTSSRGCAQKRLVRCGGASEGLGTLEALIQFGR